MFLHLTVAGITFLSAFVMQWIIKPVAHMQLLKIMFEHGRFVFGMFY